MKCPECGSLRHIVIDTHKEGVSHSRWSKRIDNLIINGIIVRIRECLNLNCKARFWTHETIETSSK